MASPQLPNSSDTPSSQLSSALDRLTQLHPKLIDLGLERTIDLSERMGSPHLSLPPTLHLAGTNGKGSTIDVLNAVAGIRVEGFDLGDLLGVELRHWIQWPSVAPFLVCFCNPVHCVSPRWCPVSRLSGPSSLLELTPSECAAQQRVVVGQSCQKVWPPLWLLRTQSSVQKRCLVQCLLLGT